VFKVHLVDIDRPGFLLLKAHKNKRPLLNPGDAFLIDKVKLIVNREGEIVL
jgi:hypothetical protein